VCNRRYIPGIERCVAQTILTISAVYVVFGLAFAIAFVTVLIPRIDDAATGAPLAFRLAIFPGAMLLWPILLRNSLARCRTKHDRVAAQCRWHARIWMVLEPLLLVGLLVALWARGGHS
jgi:hypothetical protein